MTNIVKFPTKQKRQNLTPRKRVFYLSYCYFGPALCQEVQNIYLKRHGYHNGERRWSIITYASYSEDESKLYSIELDSCLENDVPDMIENFNLEEEVTFDELRMMGWNGEVTLSAKLKHIVSPIYDGLQFPSFARPIHRHQFGTKVMAQSAGTPEFLAGKGLYAYTGAVRQTSPSISIHLKAIFYEVTKERHSVRAASRFSLKVLRVDSDLCELK